MEMMEAEACSKSRYRSLRFRGEGLLPTRFRTRDRRRTQPSDEAPLVSNPPQLYKEPV
jgi:hypothetical protein